MKLTSLCGIILCLILASCKPAYTVTNYSPQRLTEKQAKAYIEEMYYQGIPQKCTNVETTDESIKATFDYTTTVRDYKMVTSNSFANKNVESIFFKQIQSITLNNGQVSSTRGKCYVDIRTRTNMYILQCNSEPLAKNFIDAVEYYLKK